MSLKTDGNIVFVASLIGRELTIVHSPTNKTFQFITKDADFMHLIKQHFNGSNSTGSENVKVSVDAIKEYNVSITFSAINTN